MMHFFLLSGQFFGALSTAPRRLCAALTPAPWLAVLLLSALAAQPAAAQAPGRAAQPEQTGP